MTFKVRRILVAVGDGPATRVTQRVAELVGKSPIEVELFSMVRPDTRVLELPRGVVADISRTITESRRQILERLARPLRARGLAVTCTVATHDSLSESIAGRLKQAPAELVTIESHKHGTLARLFLLQSDYDLIRHCAVPLLIVKNAAGSAKRPILAALDPWHRSKPASLDARLVAVGRWVEKQTGAALHSLHVYAPILGLVSDTAFAPVSLPVTLPEEKAHAAAVKRRFRMVNTRFRIAPRRRHLECGDAGALLPEVAKGLKAQLVVMGAVSRSAFDRFLLGSTAERVLDALPCDVLVVHPTGP